MKIKFNFLFISILILGGCSNLNKLGYFEEQDKYGLKLSCIYFQTENDPKPFINHFISKFGEPSYLEPATYVWDSIYNTKWHNDSFNFRLNSFKFENGYYLKINILSTTNRDLLSKIFPSHKIIKEDVQNLIDSLIDKSSNPPKTDEIFNNLKSKIRFEENPIRYIKNDYDVLPNFLQQQSPYIYVNKEPGLFEGEVWINFEINKEGIPEKLMVVRSLSQKQDLLAVQAIKEYRFSPAMLKGNPVEFNMSTPVHFIFL